MTEPDSPTTEVDAEAIVGVQLDSGAVNEAQTDQPLESTPSASEGGETSSSGHVVLATRAPHTLLVTPELTITPAGTSVPAADADEHIATGAKYGVPVFKKGV